MTVRAGTRVLIVEDERDLAELMQTVLEDEGYDVRVHRNGNCSEAIQAFEPDVILCDYMLPYRNGEAVLRDVRQSDFSDVPCILISAVQRAAAQWREWGADDFLAKPFDIDPLLAAVERAARGDARLWSRRTPIGRSDEQAS